MEVEHWFLDHLVASLVTMPTDLLWPVSECVLMYSKVVPAHSMKSYRGSRCIMALILNLCTKWRWATSFTLRLLYPVERAPGTHWIGDLVNFLLNFQILKMTTLSLSTHFAMSVEMFLGHCFLGHGGQHHRPLRFPHLKSLIFIFFFWRGGGAHARSVVWTKKWKN